MAATDARFVHGREGKFLYGTGGTPTEFDVLQFEATFKVGKEDVTHTGANGFQVLLAGVESCSGTVTFLYDRTKKPTVSPQIFNAGGKAVLRLRPDGTDDFEVPVMFENVRWASGPQAGGVKVTATFDSTGEITYPTA